MQTTTKLLVSVKNFGEAKTALSAGADYIDIKDPESGSLGKASTKVISSIAKELGEHANPLSAALGELSEWTPEITAELPASLDYVKIGLSGMRSRSGWRDIWSETIREVARQHPERRLKWIAVAYIDHLKAHAPQAEEVIKVAGSLGCAGVLFDTYDKSSQRFFDYFTAADLDRYKSEIHHHKMLCAVAGRLTREDVARASGLGADIVAVRSAACVQNDRSGEVSDEAIRELKRVIQSVGMAQ